MDPSTFYEVVGNVHLHTVHSDGSGTHEDVATAARQAGLDFVIPTDHNVLVKEKEGWRNGVLMLVGEETNDPDPPQANHFLSFDIDEDVVAFAADPQSLIDEVRRQGGFGFIAHPCERPAQFIGEDAFDWEHWEVEGYTGISIWNYMSEFKSYLSNLPMTLLAIFFSNSVIRGPFPETLALYDRLLQPGRPVPLIGASDAHANVYAAGPLKLKVFPYVQLFKTVNLHLLLAEPFSDDLAQDRALVYEAMRAGRSFVGYHVLGDPRGFSFAAQSVDGGMVATFGQEFTADGEVQFEIHSPLRARLRLLRDGKVVAEKTGRRLAYRSGQAGVYRVEAFRWAWFHRRGWVFTNPIYVR